ncbi:GDSL-type esterase/lipase family protein [Paenibacillus aurantius]|uniref:GDSL-type esterase/lipase family protein n=1 Tax=Paenibacillus aurantius TaxID=2918900 RepID=A0AA96RFG2_9BACL|nr:GDSL-type esterase/lipase family protein [Paenibacillus aurantius]WNQ11426.1 GDSL-type esterase/lipase family protein [Paenibacillus aurantius]
MKRNVGLMAVVFVVVLAAWAESFPAQPAGAEPSHYRFDFGDGDVEKGYIGIKASDRYTEKQRYGFNTPEHMINVPASGTGVASDAVQFVTYGTKSDNTFQVDLPNGLYEVKVTLGNTTRASVAAEGVYQIINMTGNNAVDSFQIPITDGQLNLLVTEGKAGTNFTLSALEINKLSRHPVTNRTVYIGGDSTVCNYYPLDSSIQAGWGQLFPSFVDSGTFLVRNMASGGQIARGFRNDGQLEAILKYIKPGDYFLLEMGINDTNPKNTTTEAQFKEYMRDMVQQVKSKGATPVLVTPQGRATDFNAEGVHSSVNRWYRASTLALAQEENVPLVDLNVLSSAYFTEIGPEATLALYMKGDTLHPNRSGAEVLARLVAEDLKRQGLDGFTGERKPGADPAVPNRPQ